MASAPEVAPVQDIVSVPDAASVADAAPATNGTSGADATSVPNGTSNPNGTALSNGTSVLNGTTNGITNGNTHLNGTSSTSPIANGISAVASVSDDPVTFPVPEGPSTSSSAPVRIKLAIIGGGIGGIALALGLLEHPQIDFQIYEAAPIWVQIGAGLGLGPNAQEALISLGPEAEAAFRKNVTGNLWETHQKTFLNFFAVSFVPHGELNTPAANILTYLLRNLGSRSQRRPAYSHPEMLYGTAVLPPRTFRQRPHRICPQGSRTHEQTSGLYRRQLSY